MYPFYDVFVLSIYLIFDIYFLDMKKYTSLDRLSDLRIADLELWITAARRKSLQKAAEVHHLSQSAASVAIQRVEIAFQQPLCTHEKRQFGLTDAGKQLLPKAEEWVRQLRERLISTEPTPIRIATTHSLAQAVVSLALATGPFELKLMRPDLAYQSVLHADADLAIVLDNAPWRGVIARELGKGAFQLFSKNPRKELEAIFLPEEQMEVIALQQRWQEMYATGIPVRARLPSWSLIADVCSRSDAVGFLPDFLATRYALSPVSWQPQISLYRVLGLYQKSDLEERMESLLQTWSHAFF